jgi:hypothetical protein
MLHQINRLGKALALQPAVVRASSLHHPTQEFDDLVLRHDPQVTIRQPTAKEIGFLLEAATATIDAPLARLDTVARVLARDPETVWVFESSGRITGGFAFLYLNGLGVERLKANELDTRDPPSECLVGSGEPPVGCYWWLGVRLDRGPHGISQVLEFLRGQRFAHADFWMNPFTDDGVSFATKMGFSRYHAAASPTLYRYVRKANRAAARGG